MMGFKIVATGFVVFITFAFLAHLSKQPPKNDTQFLFFGSLMLAGMAAIPVGLIVTVWS